MKRLAASAVLLLAHVAHADVPKLAPNLYERGNLRVAIACARDGFVVPDTGLRVSLDGEMLRPLHVNDAPAVEVDSDGNAYLGSESTDVGYLAPEGRHHLRIEAPDCEPDERDLDVSATYAEHIDGRLEARPELRTPTAAPDGFSFLLGALTAPYLGSGGSGTKNDGLTTTAYTIDPTSETAVWLSWGIVRGAMTWNIDTMFGWGSLSGTVKTISAPSDLMAPTGTYGYTGSFFQSGIALRIGAQVPWHDVALAAGSGIGGSLWTSPGTHVDQGSSFVYATPPGGPTGDFYLPLWSSLTFKPGCSWGVQGMASYDVRPFDTSTSSLALSLGVMWQPSSACSQPGGVTVSP